LAAIQ